MPREKVTPEERTEAAKACVEGRMSAGEAARRLDVDESQVREWVFRYKAHGAEAFREQERSTVYSSELKAQAVREYIKGNLSQREIAAKYGLRSTSQIRDWIKVYNSGRNFERQMSGGSRMKQGRETTQKERRAIVRDCLENGSNFGAAAIKYNVSYQQVYTWVPNGGGLFDDHVSAILLYRPQPMLPRKLHQIRSDLRLVPRAVRNCAQRLKIPQARNFRIQYHAQPPTG